MTLYFSLIYCWIVTCFPSHSNVSWLADFWVIPPMTNFLFRVSQWVVSTLRPIERNIFWNHWCFGQENAHSTKLSWNSWKNLSQSRYELSMWCCIDSVKYTVPLIGNNYMAKVVDCYVNYRLNIDGGTNCWHFELKPFVKVKFSSEEIQMTNFVVIVHEKKLKTSILLPISSF